jgi:hypothetical protein
VDNLPSGTLAFIWLDLDATVQLNADGPVDMDDAVARHIRRIDAWIDQVTRAKAKGRIMGPDPSSSDRGLPSVGVKNSFCINGN